MNVLKIEQNSYKIKKRVNMNQMLFYPKKRNNWENVQFDHQSNQYPQFAVDFAHDSWRFLALNKKKVSLLSAVPVRAADVLCINGKKRIENVYCNYTLCTKIIVSPANENISHGERNQQFSPSISIPSKFN